MSSPMTKLREAWNAHALHQNDDTGAAVSKAIDAVAIENEHMRDLLQVGALVMPAVVPNPLPSPDDIGQAVTWVRRVLELGGPLKFDDE